MLDNILEIARAGGREPKGSGPEYKIACPYPERHQNGDTNPSCSLNPAKGVWHCLGCDAGGGPQALAAALGVDGVARGTPAPALSTNDRVRLTAIHARGEVGLRNEQGGKAFLANRALDVDAASDVGIGYVRCTDPNDPEGLPVGEWMTMTSFDAVGPALVKLRMLQDKKSQRRLPAGAPSLLFNLHNLDPFKTVLVTEGEFDVTALTTVGISNAVSVPGGNGTKVDAALVAPLSRTPLILVATDQDAAGDDLAQRLALELGHDRCKRVHFGPHKDANDALMAGATRAEFDGWINTATQMEDPSWSNPIELQLVCRTPFPVDAFPSPFREMVLAVSIATQTPVDLSAFMALGVLSAASAGKFKILAKNDHEEPVNLYLAAFMDPANRKSSVARPFMSVLDDHADLINRTGRNNESTHKARKNDLQARLKAAEKEVAEAKTADEHERAIRSAEQFHLQLDALRPFTEFRPHVSDCTPEKLASLLHSQNGVVSVFDTEGAFIANIGGRYDGKHQPNLEVVLKAHSGDPVNVDRQSGPPLSIRAPALTICMVAQPEVLRQMGSTSAFAGRGLNARFCYSIPASRIGHRDVDPPGVPTETKDAYRRAATDLINIELPIGENGHPAPHQLRLGPEARASYLDLARDVELRLQPDGDLQHIGAFGGKYVGAVVRVSALLHLAANASVNASWNIPISAETFEAARLIGRYLVDHAKVAFARMGAHASLESSQYLLASIKRMNLQTFTARDLFQKTKGKFSSMAELEPVLNLLEDHGYVRKSTTDRQQSKLGRPASATYQVNPRWFKPPISPTASAAPTGSAPATRPDDQPTGGTEGPVVFDASELPTVH